MRHLICIALLTAVFGFGSIDAADLTPAETQLLLSLTQSATTKGGPAADITLNIGGKSVVMTVSRDGVGNVTARPKADPANANLGISQINIQMKTNANGTMEPKSMLLIGSDQAITSYVLALNKDGTISQSQSGTFAYSAGGGGEKPKGGLGNPGTGGGSGKTAYDKVDAWLSSSFPGFNSSQLGLPAGAGIGEVSGSKP
jgi:hypothetical protein